jgi:glycosyltransferase involved in cell wall biosynthesis
LNEIQKFSVVHQLTQITFREPGYLWKLGIPFVWGPTGGTSTFPGSFHRILSFQSRLLDRIRTISLYYQFYFSPRVRKAIKQAATIYVFSRLDEERFKKRANGNVKVMLDVGTYSQIAVKPAVKINQGKLKVIWCGRLDEFKALFILLHSIAGSDLIQQNVTFQIVGSGPLGDSLRHSAKKLHLSNIEWTGRVSHEEVFNLMGKADFFVHTSIREATSSVIPEALSMGLPVICHDAYGMGIAVNDSCGIKIPLVSPERSIACFRSAIEQLVCDRVLLSNLKRGAFRRVSEINWDNMARTISVDYYNIIVSKKDQ